ncbi:hypothetical protein BASA61_007963 [Batrachochytrium salamandrivorans]|nr:hypothetical protein BASA61_007963 [Batrachochytrium salamandrivorans]
MSLPLVPSLEPTAIDAAMTTAATTSSNSTHLPPLHELHDINLQSRPRTPLSSSSVAKVAQDTTTTTHAATIIEPKNMPADTFTTPDDLDVKPLLNPAGMAEILQDTSQIHKEQQPTIPTTTTIDHQLDQFQSPLNMPQHNYAQALHLSLSQLKGADDPLQLSSIYFALSQKFYYCGFVYKKNELGADGKPILVPETSGHTVRGGEWTKLWMELWGPILQLWRVPDDLAEYSYTQSLNMEKFIAHEMDPAQEFLAAIKSTHASPIYINVTDAITELFPNDFQLHSDVSLARPPPIPYTSVFALSNAGSNLMLFSCISGLHCNTWVAAIRLVSFELHKLNQLFTYRLLNRPLLASAWEAAGIAPFESFSYRGQVKYEGMLQVRLTYATQWKSYYVVATSRVGLDSVSTPYPSTSSSLTKKLFGKKSISNLDFSKRGNMMFYESKSDAKKGKHPVFVMDSLRMVHALWPEKPEFIEMGLVCMAKLVGVIRASTSSRSRASSTLFADGADIGQRPSSTVGMANVSSAASAAAAAAAGSAPSATSTGGSSSLSPHTFTNYSRGFPSIASATGMRDILDGVDPRPSPHHILILASSTDELAKWLTSIYAAFSLDTDRLQADADIEEMARMDPSSGMSESHHDGNVEGDLPTSSVGEKSGSDINAARGSIVTTTTTTTTATATTPSAHRTHTPWPTPLFLSTSEVAGVLMANPIPLDTYMHFSQLYTLKLAWSRSDRMRGWCESVAKGEWERSLAARRSVEAKLRVLFEFVHVVGSVLSEAGVVLPNSARKGDQNGLIGPGGPSRGNIDPSAHRHSNLVVKKGGKKNDIAPTGGNDSSGLGNITSTNKEMVSDDGSHLSASNDVSSSDGEGSISEEENSDEGSQSENEEDGPESDLNLNAIPAFDPNLYMRSRYSYDHDNGSNMEQEFQIYGQNSLLAQREMDEQRLSERLDGVLLADQTGGQKVPNKRHTELLGIVHQQAPEHIFQSNSLLSRPDATMAMPGDGNAGLGGVNRSTAADGPLLGNVQGEANLMKPKLEGGLLGEMNRREKEREYLKRLGYYKATGPTGGVIPPSFYQQPQLPGGLNYPGMGMQGMGMQGMGMYGMGMPGMGMQGMGMPGMGMYGMGMQGMGMQGMGMQGMGMQGMGMHGMGMPGMMYNPQNPMLAFIPPEPTDDGPEDPIIVQHREMVRQQWLEVERSKERQRMMERNTEGMPSGMGMGSGMGMQGMGMQGMGMPGMGMQGMGMQGMGMYGMGMSSDIINSQARFNTGEYNQGMQSNYRQYMAPNGDSDSDDNCAIGAIGRSTAGHGGRYLSSSSHPTDSDNNHANRDSNTSESDTSRKPSSSGTEDDDNRSDVQEKELISGTESDESVDDESDEDVPLHELAARKKVRSKPAPALRPVGNRGASTSESDTEDEESDDNVPLMDPIAPGRRNLPKRVSDSSSSFEHSSGHLFLDGNRSSTIGGSGDLEGNMLDMDKSSVSDSSDEPLGARVSTSYPMYQNRNVSTQKMIPPNMPHNSISLASLGSHFHGANFGSSGSPPSGSGPMVHGAPPVGMQLPNGMPMTPQMQHQMQQLQQLQMQQMQLMQQMGMTSGGIPGANFQQMPYQNQQQMPYQNQQQMPYQNQQQMPYQNQQQMMLQHSQPQRDAQHSASRFSLGHVPGPIPSQSALPLQQHGFLPPQSVPKLASKKKNMKKKKSSLMAGTVGADSSAAHTSVSKSTHDSAVPNDRLQSLMSESDKGSVSDESC